MTIINKTMVPLNKYGVPCADALSYPSRSNSSSVGEGSPGTFYLKKSNQGLYLVEAKMKSLGYVLAWNWSFVQTTNLCDPGINVNLAWYPTIDGRIGYVCPYVSDINSKAGFYYNTGAYEGAFARDTGCDYAFMYWIFLSNKPTDVSKLVLDVSATGEVYFVFTSSDGKVCIIILAGDGSLFNLEEYDEVYYGNEIEFTPRTINWVQFGLGHTYNLGGDESTFSFRDVSFYRLAT